MNRKPTSPSLRPHQAPSLRPIVPPTIEYPEELPISAHREQLVDLIRRRQVIVVCGETGSGKSTQLPKFCLAAGLGQTAMIGHTQPRRLAARSLATRIAEELGSIPGDLVGYQVRFGDQTSERTRIKLMTDGILLAETQSDRALRRYDAIIIDEAHERSLNIDFLLGYLRRLQTKRPELRIIITSATIDAERFAAHFADEHGPAPIVNVEGRGYPVELRYLPWDEVADDEQQGYDLSRHVIAGMEAARHGESGDLLVFLPTERDIREVSHRVSGHYKRLGWLNQIDLLPLYARLPNSEQQKIFHPDGRRRRIIFATNVAESSLTVPGIRCVIDAGTARISRYSGRTRIQRLPVEPVSRASADQRAGRCGRIGPGLCVRLYSAADYDARDAFTTPEIRRTSLASVILQMKTLRLGKLDQFPLLDPPRTDAVREGIRTLRELGALDDRHELTDIGWQLGRMPVDPRVGRIILAAQANGVLPEVLPIAAALEIQDPRDRPPDKRAQADQAHAAFADSRSDFLGYLRLWRHYSQLRSDLSRGKLIRALRKQYLSPSRMREWADVYRQLRELASISKQRIGGVRYDQDDDKLVSDDRYAAIHRSLLAGLLSGVAQKDDNHQYNGAHGLKLFVWPGSGVFASKPNWIVAAELVETTRQYARTVARVDPRWIEQVGQHLLKRTHSDPHWSSKSNAAFCHEQGTLFGLTVYAGRKIPLPPIDPVTARELLIDQGLADNQLRTTAGFVRHNRSLIESIARLAAKTRSRDLVIDHHQIARFYQTRLPRNIVDRAGLEEFDRSLDVPSWTKQLRDSAAVSQWLDSPPPRGDHESLFMRPDDLVAATTQLIADEDFPDELVIGQSRLPLEYRFEPGSDRDGINVKVHQSALAQISDDRLGWLVPGLLQPKLIAMIKSLPKRIRRNLVPAAEVAKQIAAELQDDYGKTAFLTTVCQALSRHADMPVTPGDFQSDKLAQNLQFLVTVVDDDGQAIAEARSVDALPGRAESPPAPASDETDQAWARSAMRELDIEQLPLQVIRTRGGVQVAQFPGLVDLGDAVATRLYADQRSAESSLRQGMMRLYAINQRKALRSQVRWLPSLEDVKVKLSGIVPAAKMEAVLIDLLARIAFVEGQPVLRTKHEFESRLGKRGERIAEAAHEIAGWLGALADSYFAVRRSLESTRRGGRFADVISDLNQQLDWLLHDSFLSTTPWQWLQHYPRYLRAIEYRLDKVRSGGGKRDLESMQQVQQLGARWLDSLPADQQTPSGQADCEFRWLLEELRVSLFAQPLGTAVKVSIQRCEKLL